MDFDALVFEVLAMLLDGTVGAVLKDGHKNCKKRNHAGDKNNKFFVFFFHVFVIPIIRFNVNSNLWGKMSSIKNNVRVAESVKLVQKFVPEFKVIRKSKSVIHRIIGTIFALVGNKDYLRTFWTTIKYTTAAPTCYDDGFDTESWKTILHEGVHAMQRTALGIWFEISYLSPQILGILSVVAQGALLWLGLWSWWCLLPIVFLAPLPAYWRAKLEWEAYRVSIACDYWHWKGINPKAREKYISSWLVPNFCGPNYYWMWPFKKSVIKKANDIIKSLDDGSFEMDEYTRACKEMCSK